MNRIRLALPKGRVLAQLGTLLTKAGLAPDEDLDASRKLVSPVSSAPDVLGADLELLLLKNSDVPVYVEHGVAEVGVSGTDVLHESGMTVLRPHTFGFGSCDIVLAGKPEHGMDYLHTLPIIHVATKYLRFARDHFGRVGWPVELIPLQGSVELAPVLGLADAIVDLCETGKTLKENGLQVHEVIGCTHLKLIANRALSRKTAEAVERLITLLSQAER